MAWHRFAEQTLVTSFGHDWRVPGAALVVALAAVLLARPLKLPRLAQAAPGLGIAVGWALCTGFALAPRAAAGRLPLLELVLLAASLFGTGLSRRAPAAFVALLSLAAAWWLAEAPRTAFALWHAVWAVLAAFVITFALAGILVRTDRWRIAGASAALAAALHAVGVAALWPLLALIPAAAAIGAWGVAAAEALLPAALGVGLAASVTVLAAGRLMHGGAGRVEAAVLAPLAASWLSGRLLPRLRRLGAAAPACAALLAFAIVALLALSAAAIAGLR